MYNTIPLVEEKNYDDFMKNEVEPYLEKIRKDGYFTARDGKQLHYEAHIVANPVRTVVISHGFTEFAEKFREMAYYFTNNNYSVFAIDHRGHGKSYRISKNPCTVDIMKFDDYIDDLDTFVKDVVIPASDSTPLALFGHSMGGGIAARYIQVYPDVFDKVILTAPMICAQPGMPVGIAKNVSAFAQGIGLGRVSVPGMCKFNPDALFEKSSDSSRDRFNYFLELKRKNKEYQTAGPSFSWISEAMKLTDVLLDDNNCKKVSAKVIVFQAGSDHRVISSYQDTYVAKLNDASLVHVPGSKHEIFASTNDVLEGYLEKIFEFLEG